MKIDRIRARADYLAMGPGRAVVDLHTRYTADTNVRAPCVDAMRQWCAKDGWVAAAQEHDAQVSGELSRRAIDANVEATWNAAKELMETARVASDKLRESLPTLDVKDAAAAKALADVLVTVARLAGDMGRGETTPAEAQRDVGDKAKIIYDLLEKRRKERKSA